MNEIWIVEGTCGEYSDQQSWLVAWCETAEDAARLISWCEAEADTLTEYEAERWYEEAAGKAREMKLKHDPNYRTDYTGTKYSARPLKRWAPGTKP